MSTFSLILAGGEPYYYRPSRSAIETMSDTSVRSRRVAPPDRRDRRPAAGSADRARSRSSSRVAASKQQQRRRRAASAGARGGDPPPPGRAQQRRASRRRAWCGSGASCSPRRSGMQGAFAVAVYAPPEAPGFWDLARDHYGSHTPMLAYRSAGAGDPRGHRGQAAVGVLPMPQEERARSVVAASALERTTATPHVIARLPFGGRGNARADGGDALAIGRGAEQPTGRDRTLLATENAPEYQPRPHVLDAGRRSDLTLHLHRVAASTPSGANTLIEIDGFVPRRRPAARTLPRPARRRRCTGCCRSAATRCRCRRPS